MNSSISSSNLHRLYVKRLLALTLVPVFGLFALGVYLQPLYGDLTRIGLYAEKDFGWNKPQLEFRQPLFEIGRYDRYHDVVVLGDSFSNAWPNHQWQNHLVMTTGWSLATLDFGKTKLEQILESRTFRETPPKFLIIEWVERYLPQRLKHKQPCKVPPPRINAFPKSPPVALVSKSGEIKSAPNYAARKTTWSDIKLGWVVRYFWLNMLRSNIGDKYTDVMKVDLFRPAPFSSENKQGLLVYKDDFSKVKKWQQMSLAEMGCGIEMMREKVEANGYTRFVLMVAPDKLTAYAEFVRDKKLRSISALPTLSDQLPEVIPRLDLALISAIRRGEQDIYLPDDTHWGSTGHQIVAETLLTFLQPYESGNLANPSPIYNER